MHFMTQGSPPLHVAAAASNLNMMGLLLEAGADLQATDDKVGADGH